MWISPLPAWCLFQVKLLFSPDLGGLHICQRRLSQKIRSFLFTHPHSHMDVLNHTAVVVGRKNAASFGGHFLTMLEKRENSRKLLHFYWTPLLVIESEQLVDLSYFDKN